MTEVSKVISIIKSCLAISHQQELTVDQLQDDYTNLIGSKIPFKNLGHGTLISFLQSQSKDFQLRSRGCHLLVASLNSSEMVHIEKLVQCQKNSKKRILKPMISRRPKGPSQWDPRRHMNGRQAPRIPRYQNPTYGLLPTPSIQPYQNQITNHWAVPPFRNTYYTPIIQYQPPPKKAVASQLTVNENGVPSSNKPSTATNSSHKSLSVSTSSSKVTSAKSKLIKIAAKNNIEAIFETVQFGKSQSSYVSTVKIGDKKYMSYPKVAKTTAQAEEFVSAIAMKDLEDIKYFESNAIIQTDDSEVACKRIKQILNQKSEGIWWWKYIQEEYLKQFNETLNPDWITMSNNNQQFYAKFYEHVPDWQLSLMTEEAIENDICVNNLEKVMSGSDNTDKLSVTRPLQFPNDKMWNVFITYIKDCKEIWFRLIEDEFNDQFESLVTDMELYYMEPNNMKTVKDFKIGACYACNHDESWFRIVLHSVQGNLATVFFVDNGDFESVLVSALHTLTPIFQELPYQAIKVSLRGLECGYTDNVILSHLQNLVLGRSLVAEVVSKTVHNDISVILFDTSTNIDININERLVNLLDQNFPQPSLPDEGGISEVYVLHVNSDGLIHIRIESATFKILEDLMLTARKRTAEIFGDEDFNIDLTKLYLAKFSSDGEWHRAIPRTSVRNVEGVLLTAIDIGKIERVPILDMVPLSSLSTLLCKIPSQAIPVRLHQVPSSSKYQWTERVTNRLLEILPENEPILLKVMKTEVGTDPPYVQLLKRVEPQNLLVSINVTLDADMKLFSIEDRNNNVGCKSIVEKSLAYHMVKSLLIDSEEEILSLSSCGPILPTLNVDFNIYVTFAAGPFSFAVMAYENYNRLKDLMNEMKVYYSKEINLKHIPEIVNDKLYAVLHEDGAWYRCQVQSDNGDIVVGKFVDYGNLFSTTLDKIQPLKSIFMQLSCQSIKARLNGIIPVNVDWTPEDCIKFRKMVENQSFVSKVNRIENSDQGPVLHMEFIDAIGDHNEANNIGNLFIKENRAVRCSNLL